MVCYWARPTRNGRHYVTNARATQRHRMPGRGQPQPIADAQGALVPLPRRSSATNGRKLRRQFRPCRPPWRSEATAGRSSVTQSLSHGGGASTPVLTGCICLTILTSPGRPGSLRAGNAGRPCAPRRARGPHRHVRSAPATALRGTAVPASRRSRRRRSAVVSRRRSTPDARAD